MGLGHSIEGNQTRQDRIKKIVEEEYKPLFAKEEIMSDFSKFYRSVTQLVQEINKKYGYKNPIKVPPEERLRGIFQRHHRSKEKPMTTKEFKDILQELVIKDAGFMEVFGGFELLIFIFGVPMAASMFKEGALRSYKISNTFFIPTVTSLTAFVLAKLNKV